jgi:hypothetical protein
MAILRKVKAVMRTFVEISSIQEIPELKPYLSMTFTEIIMSWKAKKMHARMALMKWILLKTSLIFIRPNFPPLTPRNPVNYSNPNSSIQEVQSI